MGSGEAGKFRAVAQPEDFIAPLVDHQGECFGASEVISAIHRINNLQPEVAAARIKEFGEMRRAAIFSGERWNVYTMVADSECESDIYYFKIGVAKNVPSRLMGIVTGCPLPIVQVLYRGGFLKRQAFRIEKALHLALKPYRVRGEWFRFDSTDIAGKGDFSRACKEIMHPYMSCGEEFRWERMNEPEIKDLMDTIKKTIARNKNLEKGRARLKALSNPYVERVIRRA